MNSEVLQATLSAARARVGGGTLTHSRADDVRSERLGGIPDLMALGSESDPFPVNLRRSACHRQPAPTRLTYCS